MGFFSSKETVVYRFCHWQAHQRARKSQNEQAKPHILQQRRDQKRFFLPAADPGISLDSWSPQLEILASFATAYRTPCWEMPKRSSLLQRLPSSLWSAGKRWEMITSIARNSHESTKYCHLLGVFSKWQGGKDQKEDVNLNTLGPAVKTTAWSDFSAYEVTFLGDFSNKSPIF